MLGPQLKLLMREKQAQNGRARTSSNMLLHKSNKNMEKCSKLTFSELWKFNQRLATTQSVYSIKMILI